MFFFKKSIFYWFLNDWNWLKKYKKLLSSLKNGKFVKTMKDGLKRDFFCKKETEIWHFSKKKTTSCRLLQKDGQIRNFGFNGLISELWRNIRDGFGSLIKCSSSFPGNRKFQNKNRNRSQSKLLFIFRSSEWIGIGIRDRN